MIKNAYKVSFENGINITRYCTVNITVLKNKNLFPSENNNIVVINTETMSVRVLFIISTNVVLQELAKVMHLLNI